MQLEPLAIRGGEPRMVQDRLHLLAHEIVHAALAQDQLLEITGVEPHDRLVRLHGILHRRTALTGTAIADVRVLLPDVQEQRLAAVRVQLRADAMIQGLAVRVLLVFPRRSPRREALQVPARMPVLVVEVVHVHAADDEQPIEERCELGERAPLHVRGIERAESVRPEALRLGTERAVLPLARDPVRLIHEDHEWWRRGRTTRPSRPRSKARHERQPEGEAACAGE
jgi:hypothetical protein